MSHFLISIFGFFVVLAVIQGIYRIIRTMIDPYWNELADEPKDGNGDYT